MIWDMAVRGYTPSEAFVSNLVAFGVGEAIGYGMRAVGRGLRGTFDDVVDPGSPLRRPDLRKSTREAIENFAPKTPEGIFIDPNTGELLTGDFHFGHAYGYENRRLIKEAQSRGMTQQEFNDWVNAHPEWFQIEDPASNLSHKFEKPGG
ncbi:MAG: hypothetical protein E4G99_11895 [Anaerolineales bacterium]|nr:MAG: hypothetical protein E4G99_11895 [Anaerolineales bacterium]